jgi:hypothetical protein
MRSKTKRRCRYFRPPDKRVHMACYNALFVSTDLATTFIDDTFFLQSGLELVSTNTQYSRVQKQVSPSPQM